MYNAIHLYRLARWLYLHHIPLIPMMIQLIIFCGYGCRLSYKTKIGKGFTAGDTICSKAAVFLKTNDSVFCLCAINAVNRTVIVTK